MSAVANIVLADGQATPVNHTFLPLGPDTNGVWWFEDQSGTSVIGYNRISLELKRTLPAAAGVQSGPERVNRVKIGLHLPTLETLGTNDAGITPPPRVAYVARCNMEFILPERAAYQNREDVRVFARGLLADTQVINMIEYLQAVF